jgi:DNA (cytosine-5)-methyltransferase 1
LPRIGVTLKILNLYAGIGGNRKSWGTQHQITAVEYDPQIAEVYRDLYPTDEIIVADAHQFLLDNYQEYDFIWSSPPCQSHSSFRHNIGVRFRGVKPKYPDMSLYEEIVFLEFYAKGLWVVENVNPFYGPMRNPKKIDRHLYWSNFEIPDREVKVEKLREAQIPQLQELHGVDLSNYKLANKRQILRNCVYHETGKYILEAAEGAMK